MRLPVPLLRRDPAAHKNDFGHVLVLAGSRHMLGAAALSALSAMRTGAGLVTVGIPASLNTALQKKISPVVMTLSLPETTEQSISARAWNCIQEHLDRFDAIALGPGLSRHPQTQRLVLKIIKQIAKPLVIDADALFAVASKTAILRRTKGIKILTPHEGEMARLIHERKDWVNAHRRRAAAFFAKNYECILILKGRRTIVAAPSGGMYINTTGNVGLATAGSGDVLTGMIAALLGQGIDGWSAARWGVYLHGKAGDSAARKKTAAAMLATDVIEEIPTVLKMQLKLHSRKP